MKLETLAEILTNARRRSGYTVREAAALIGTTASNLCAFETGKSTNPTLRVVAGICDLYGISEKRIVNTVKQES